MSRRQIIGVNPLIMQVIFSGLSATDLQPVSSRLLPQVSTYQVSILTCYQSYSMLKSRFFSSFESVIKNFLEILGLGNSRTEQKKMISNNLFYTILVYVYQDLVVYSRSYIGRSQECANLNSKLELFSSKLEIRGNNTYLYKDAERQKASHNSENK